MKRAVLVLLLVSGGLVAGCSRGGDADDGVVLELALADRERVFQIGETIPIKLSFSSRAKDRYQLNEAHYDRSGRMDYEQFTVEPADGAVDPLPDLDYSMGGLTNYVFLTPEAWTIELNLNEWVRFTKPGEYRLVVTSQRVEVPDLSAPGGTAPVPARSNGITIRIRAADTEWQQRTCREAVAVLDCAAPAEFRDDPRRPTPREQAVDALRFLGTPDAAREMAKRLRDDLDDPRLRDNVSFYCMLGLIASPAREAARDPLEQALIDPEHPVTDHFLRAYEVVAFGAEPFRDRTASQEHRRMMEHVVAVLPAKRGKALATSLSAVADAAWSHHSLPAQKLADVVRQLTSRFDELPEEERHNLLEYRWEKIASPALLPLLQRYAETPRQAGRTASANRLAVIALKRWYDLDPIAARPAVLREITHPQPRLDFRSAGILPDETLPEADQALAENFAGPSGTDRLVVAHLIARYATSGILPQVLAAFEARPESWDCGEGNAIFAYLVRVDPESARPRLEKAVGVGGEGYTACRMLFSEVSKLCYHPLLEKLAVFSLGDRNPAVAADAATMLQEFGSTEAEPALRRRFESWNEECAGRDTELATADIATSGIDVGEQDRLGRTLAEALARGHGWLIDRAGLQRLVAASTVARVRQQLEQYLRAWRDERPTVAVGTGSSAFSGRVAQYHYESFETLEQKIAQFPPGTTFCLLFRRDAPPQTTEAIAAVRAFMISHGFSFDEEEEHE